MIDDHKPTPTSVDDSAAVNTIDNGDLVEAVARTLFDDLEQYGPDPSSWGDICILEKLPWKRSAQAALDTAVPLIRAQRDAEIAAWLREHAPHWGHEALADAIERGEVG